MRQNQYTPLKERVREYLMQKIEAGELKEGDKIVELNVCDELGVSRTPVREALNQLSTDGYLENVPRKGFRVKGFDEESAGFIFEIIGPLDGRAALLALPNMDKGDITQLKFLCASMDIALESSLYDRYDDLQQEFHFLYIDKCGNPKLSSLLHDLWRFFSKASYSIKDDQKAIANLKLANEEHREIVTLFEKSDGKALQDYIRDVHWKLENAQYATWQ